MIKKLIWLFLFVGCFGYSQPYKFENDELKGNVQSLELFILKNNNPEKLVEHKTFDKKGRILTSKTYDFDGKWIRSNERNQYSDNQIITTFCECEDLDKAFANFYKKGVIKNEESSDGIIVYATNNPPIRRHRDYKITDESGNVISSKRYTSEGYFSRETKSTYDKNSNFLLEENFDSQGEKSEYFKKNTYNEKGLLTEKITSEIKFVFEYDDLERKISEEEWSGNKRVLKISYEYMIAKDTSKVFSFWNSPEEDKYLKNTEFSYFEGNKRIAELTEVNKDGSINFRTVSEYDKNNNLVSKKHYNYKNELRSETKLVYDNNENWIEMNLSKLIKTSYDGSEPKPEWRTEKYIRKIQYY